MSACGHDSLVMLALVLHAQAWLQHTAMVSDCEGTITILMDR